MKPLIGYNRSGVQSLPASGGLNEELSRLLYQIKMLVQIYGFIEHAYRTQKINGDVILPFQTFNAKSLQ